MTRGSHEGMKVETILEKARRRLATVSDRAPLVEAAGLLKRDVDLVVVCGREQKLVGVVAKTDVVGRISTCQGAGCTCAVETVMTRDVLSCSSHDDLSTLWETMKERKIRNVPVLDEAGRPTAVVTIGDALAALLNETTSEERVLRDYVMGFGYR